jgi:cytochrome c
VKKAVLIGLALAATAAGAAIVLISVAGDEREPVVDVPRGDVERGRELIEAEGCASCHNIPGIESTGNTVGPPLGDLAERRYIAGDEPSRLSVLVRWLRNPQSIEPGTIMPDLGLSESEARDIAAYLYSE